MSVGESSLAGVLVRNFDYLMDAISGELRRSLRAPREETLEGTIPGVVDLVLACAAEYSRGMRGGGRLCVVLSCTSTSTR